KKPGIFDSSERSSRRSHKVINACWTRSFAVSLDPTFRQANRKKLSQCKRNIRPNLLCSSLSVIRKNCLKSLTAYRRHGRFLTVGLGLPYQGRQIFQKSRKGGRIP